MEDKLTKLEMIDHKRRLEVADYTANRLQDEVNSLKEELRDLKALSFLDNPALAAYEKEKKAHEATKERLIEKSKQLTISKKNIANYREMLTPKSQMKKVFGV